jgi:acyl-CoA hydrolase
MRDPERTDFKYDTIIVRVAPKDSEGRYSLGPNCDMVMTILRDHPEIQVIAEVNPNVPRTLGDNFITEKQITAKFDSNTQLAGPATVMPNERDGKIGQYLGELVDSNSYLQVGIGNVFGGFAEGLKTAGKTGIRIRTEMMGDAQMDMIKNGSAVSAETGFVYGTSDLYKFIDQNPLIKMVETEAVNDPGTVAHLPKYHAVNTALQVNLRGDVNATHGDGFRMSSPGGQVEFMSGAARSSGGKAIIALRSIAKDQSTIVLNNYMGVVTTPSASVTHVVTEFGVAKLQGVSESDKAARLISIAHPYFRPELIEQALAAKMITAERAAQIPKE